MTTFYKAVRPDGGSFNDPSFTWNLEPGGVTTHPLFRKHRANGDDAVNYLSVATVSTDCTGMKWPCRLLEVEPVGRLFTPHPTSLPNKRAALRFRTVRELPASQVFGPQGEHVVALIERASHLTTGEVRNLDAAWGAAWGTAWGAALDAAWGAAWGTARGAAWGAALDAAWGAAWDAGSLLVRDLVNTAHYDLLTLPWRTTIGPIHPDDPDWV